MAKADNKKKMSTHTSRTSRPRVSKIESSGADFFDLPRAVCRHVRACSKQHSGGGGVVPGVKYLWININAQCEDTCPHKEMPPHSLAVDDWLNVVDEAASLGVTCVMICVGNSFSEHPEVWEISRWAQSTHGLNVGFHTYCRLLSDEDVAELGRLDPERTCLFVDKAALPLMQQYEERGVRLCVADVTEEDHCPPCDEPNSMVFVGPEGVLYSCGMVLGNDTFRLGHVGEKPLHDVLEDEAVDRRVPAGTPRSHHGCHACPPLMFKRVMERGK